jgi:hypothetical protein
MKYTNQNSHKPQALSRLIYENVERTSKPNPEINESQEINSITVHATMKRFEQMKEARTAEYKKVREQILELLRATDAPFSSDDLIKLAGTNDPVILYGIMHQKLFEKFPSKTKDWITKKYFKCYKQYRKEMGEDEYVE